MLIRQQAAALLKEGTRLGSLEALRLTGRLLSCCASAQNTYVWELNHSFSWLDPAMAEGLRNDIEALRLLEQEHAQVRSASSWHMLSGHSCCEGHL